ncbi:MAG: sodium:proton antiporter [Isosphaeraceae bacterium]
MDAMQLAALLVTLTTCFAYINHRALRLPPTTGLMAISLAFSLGLAALVRTVPGLGRTVESFVGRIDLNVALLHVMLGSLLFAGALEMPLGHLTRRRLAIFALVTVGVAISTVVVGELSWAVFRLVGVEVQPIYCFVFGALISPTDPVAVVGMLKRSQAPADLRAEIAGESLFNDGVSLAFFIGLLATALKGRPIETSQFGMLLLRQGLGGVGLGLVVGLVAYQAIKPVNSYRLEILITLSVALGGYALAESLHVSAPIAVVVAGVIIGNHAWDFAMSDETRTRLRDFWELVDEFLNAVLFVLVGLEALVLDFTPGLIFAGVLMIPVMLLARLISVLIARGLVWGEPNPRRTAVLLTWGGLKGAISVALALGVPREFDGRPIPERDVLVAITYIVVVFSILVQGLSFDRYVRRVFGKRGGEDVRPDAVQPD